MVTAGTATAVLANLTTVLVAVAAGGRWVWKNLQDRLEAVEGQVGDLEATVAYLVEAEADRNPTFLGKVKRFKRTVGAR